MYSNLLSFVTIEIKVSNHAIIFYFWNDPIKKTGKVIISNSIILFNRRILMWQVFNTTQFESRWTTNTLLNVILLIENNWLLPFLSRLFYFCILKINIEILKRIWIFLQHLCRSVVHLWILSCSFQVQCLGAPLNSSSNSAVLRFGIYPCWNRKTRIFDIHWNWSLDHKISIHLKNFSFARWTLPAAWTWATFISKSIFSYQLGPLYVNRTRPVGGRIILETNVMKWNVIEAGRR